MLPVPQKPLSAKEIERLDKFLLADDGLDATMDVSTLDEFLCAVLSGPTVIVPSEWMRWVWDMEGWEQAPELRSEKQAQRILRLLMRHADDIADTLTYSSQDYAPLFHQNRSRRMVLRPHQGLLARSRWLAAAARCAAGLV